MIANPPISRITNKVANRLKYLSINCFAVAPHLDIIQATAKNLKALAKMDAPMNMGRLTFATPAVMVTSLYGRGVRPKMKTIHEFHLS